MTSTDTQEQGARPPSEKDRRGLLGRWLPWKRSLPGTPDGDPLHLPPMTRGMQAFSMVMFFLLGGAVAAFFVANPFDLHFLPGGGGETHAGEERGPGTDEGQLYQCPMHPEVVESTPGECPICGMALMPVRSGAAAHAGQEQLYQCPMHPEVVESEPGECPICGMDLVPLSSGDLPGEAGGAPGSRAEREVLYWYAPMDPTYIRDEPGLSPMGMKLVPKYAGEGGGSNVIEIDPAQVQNIGVVSVEARTETIARRSRTVGILDYNADHITWINTKFEGWIEKVHVNYVGQEVRKGQPLFEIYSPELVTTQEEYLRALEYMESLRGSSRPGARRQAESLLQSTRDRLTYWDITEDQIQALERTGKVERRLTVVSPVDGTVAEVMQDALEGMYVKAGMNLYKIADLSTVWVHADVYESDLPWIREGQISAVSFRNDPGREYRGRVLFLYPEVSRDTRTLRVCVEVPNPQGILRPGMYADVVIHGPPVPNSLVIPQSAVIHSGERNIVFVDLGQGRFEPREVTLGIKGAGNVVQVVDGVRDGELVVTQAQFMLDSESRIQEAIDKFRKRGRARSAAGPQTAPGQSH